MLKDNCKQWRPSALLLVTTFLLCFCDSLLSKPLDPTPSQWIKAGALVASGMVAARSLSLVKTPQCYWCRVNRFDEDIGRTFASSNLSAARMGSDLFTFGVVPMIAMGSVILASPGMNHALRDGLVIVASVITTAAVTEMIKISARRARPEVIFGYSSGAHDDNRSFLSGHMSFAFSILTSSSIMAFQKGYRWSRYLGGFSAIAGAMVGYSRIAAAKHWMTDVLAGMSIGITVGAIMPSLLIPPPRDSSALLASLYLVPDIESMGVQIGTRW